MMEVFKDIPFDFDYDEFASKVSINNHEHLDNDLNKLLDKVLPLIKPKAILEISYINEKDEEKIKIDETVFKSKLLQKKLKNIGRVFPYICTCGDELEELQQNIDDYLEEYWLDTLKELALQNTRKFLQSYIENKFNIDQVSSMNPGSGNVDLWPIEQQEQLFSIFGNVEEKIGVKLTDSYLMVPNKSASGIFFPTKVKFQTCKLCTREGCPERKVSFTGELKE